MADRAPARVEVMIPVHNEERQLADSVRRLSDHLGDVLRTTWRIVIVDNASTDGTWSIAEQLQGSMTGVSALRLDRKGRGLALKSSWLASEADVVSYMDVDLSTSLDHFVPLVEPLLEGTSELTIGSRHLSASQVKRQWSREVMSRTYNALIHLGFTVDFTDAQCGFKAITRHAARAILPDVRDESWFFDTELLLLAAYRGFRIQEVPVRWVEDLDSRVHLRKTVADDLRGLWRMRRQLWSRRSVARPEQPDWHEGSAQVRNPTPDADER